MNNTLNRAFFASQSAQNVQIQQLMNQAQAALLCGPECQSLRKIEQLKQNYINAQTNVIAAPDLLRQAQKNYFTTAQGIASYNDVIESQLTQKATTVGDIIQTEFDENIQNANSLIDTYQTLEDQTDFLKDLKEKYIEENAELNKEINYIFSDIATNNRKTFYQEQNLTRENGWYTLYSVIYIILLIAFLSAILLVNSKYSFMFKAFIFVLFLLYPFIASFIVFRIIMFYQHIMSLLPKNIYKHI